jgi:hypothetical protein
MSSLAATLAAYQTDPRTPEVQAALDRISADSLRGHLSFIASDALEGRNTPSRGLDITAEYIAAHFRRAGLEPVGDDGYFQTADWLSVDRSMTGFRFHLKSGEEAVEVGANQVSFTFPQALTMSSAPVLKVDFQNPAALDLPTAPEWTGRVILLEIPAGTPAAARNEFLGRIRALEPSLIVSIVRNRATGTGGGGARLVQTVIPEDPPVLSLHSPEAIRIFDAMKPGTPGPTLAINVPPVQQQQVKLRNVVGLLRGSDPDLKETYVLLTAHYDHTGIRPTGVGDRINNGANDNGSGTVSVMEIAAALSTLKERPKRSLVFMTFFGEEKGLLGSRYYGNNPIFPISKTIANVNLEQVGRTDSTEGPQVNTASLTGIDFSEVGSVFQSAGAWTGIHVYKHERNSDAYFSASDNAALAALGVPAHSLSVAFNYPDYHNVGDHWEKVDYDNMARVNRMIALGLVMMANNSDEPKWNEAIPQTAPYVRAWRERRTPN